SAQQEDPFLHLGRVRETADGIVVRGAKMLATMAPITEEVAVIPFGGVPPGDDAYALVFGIPSNTPGLSFLCRETVAPLPRSRFDHPLSSRFEEMDCIAVFDDVLVPWDRAMVDGSPGSGDIINGLGADFGALLNVQTAARMLSQLEFFCGLAMKVADAIGITGFLHVQEKLGEMLSQMEIARVVFYGSEAMAQRLGNGVWVPGGHGLRAFHLQTGKVYSRFVEIVQTLAAGGFFYAPSEADLANPDVRPYIDKYVRGREGISAEERIALFKLAWDVTGDSFAQRMQQYVRFYSGDPIRLTAGFYMQYEKAPLFEIVERALGRRPGQPIPISADDAAAPVPYQPGTRGMAGTYAATSLPARGKERN
ncbi:MAG TPA: 4-hydroxyphenylacetate 3-hydroxylase C-terminal domain-containing protein, partial [Methylomirabilota bacterium]|nr:4-hydroxyphenylacetate 3-hydroxylase C-terminal domain-containing protein [Methylomirabilota bacterium]